MSTRHLLLLTLLAHGLGGCAAELALVKGNAEADSGALDDTGAAEGDGALRLRLDVYPSGSGPALEPQSVPLLFAEDTTGLDIELSTPITLRGEVRGWLPTPPSAITVPGEEVPVIATVALEQEDSVAGAATTSDAEGAFQLKLTPGADYTLAILPLEPASVPFLVRTGLLLEDDGRLDAELLDLGGGAPVWGHVRRTDGAAVPTEVALVDEATGIQGSVTETDGTGWFMLRALPGAYTLHVLGDSSRAVPSVSLPVEVVDEEGAEINVDLGDYQAVTLDADVVDGDGEPVADVPVRLRSLELADPEWSLEIETETDNEGVLFRRLLPGTWHAELVPDRDSGLSPTTVTFEIGEDGLEYHEPIVLEPYALVSGRAVDASGAALGGVIVTAREQGYEGRTWSGSTSEDGQFAFEAPSVRLELTFTPPSSEVAITTFEHDPSTETLGDVVLSRGQEVSGRLRTTDGAVVPYAVVELRDGADDELLGTTLTDGEGNFSARIDP